MFNQKLLVICIIVFVITKLKPNIKSQTPNKNNTHGEASSTSFLTLHMLEMNDPFTRIGAPHGSQHTHRHTTCAYG
jgi:hypothetical protein